MLWFFDPLLTPQQAEAVRLAPTLLDAPKYYSPGECTAFCSLAWCWSNRSGATAAC